VSEWGLISKNIYKGNFLTFFFHTIFLTSVFSFILLTFSFNFFPSFTRFFNFSSHFAYYQNYILFKFQFFLSLITLVIFHFFFANYQTSILSFLKWPINVEDRQLRHPNKNFEKTPNMMIASQKVQKVIIIVTTDTSITLIHDYINKR